MPSLIAEVPKVDLRTAVLSVYDLLIHEVNTKLIEDFKVIDAYVENNTAFIHTRLLRTEYGHSYRIDYVFKLIKDQEPKLEFLTPLKDFDDVTTLRLIVERLWGLLDDIDTSSDMAKGDTEWQIKRIEYLHKFRYETLTSDGYSLFVRQELVNHNEPN